MSRPRSVFGVVVVVVLGHWAANAANAQTADVQVYNRCFREVLIMAIDVEDVANPVLLDKYVDQGDATPQTFRLNIPVKKDITLIAVFTGGGKTAIGAVSKKMVNGDDFVVDVHPGGIYFVERSFIRFLLAKSKEKQNANGKSGRDGPGRSKE